MTVDVTAFPVAEDEDAWGAEDALERYWNAGLPASHLTVTSDAGGSLPVFDAQGQFVRMGVAKPDALLETIRALRTRGHAFEQILPPFTSTPARHLKLTGKGQIAVGADADLLVLEDDGALWGTLARGAWHVRAGALVRAGTFERPSTFDVRSTT